MAQYTVQDTSTGKNVTFEWSDPNPPTDTDMEEVFNAARGGEAPKMSLGDVMSGAITNIPESAYNMAKGIGNTVLHPINTLKGIGQTIAGGIQSLPKSIAGVPMTWGETPESQAQEAENKAKFSAMTDFLSQRYGGVENLKKTIATDPVGFAADISTVLTGGGAALKAGGLTKAGEIVSKAGGLVDPVNAVVNTGRALVKGISKIPLTSPERLYTSAVKPPKNKYKTQAQFNREIATGLNEGILPNQGGLESLTNKVNDIEDTLDAAIQQTGGRSHFIPTKEALQYIPELIDKYAKEAKYPSESIGVIKDAAEKFLSEHGDMIDLQHAVDMKKGIGGNVKYGQNLPHASEIADFDKQLVRGLKDASYDALFNANPDLRALGQKEGALIGLKEAIQAGAQRISKRDIMGIGLPIKTGVGAAVGKATGLEMAGTVVGVMAGIIDTPLVKARLAVALNKARKKSFNMSTSKTRIAAYQAGKNK